MKIFPAIDLIGGQAVRLYQGDYQKMTVYEKDPLAVAKTFERAGAAFLHTVDLEGARDGAARRILRRSAAFSGRRISLWRSAAASAVWRSSTATSPPVWGG